MGECKTKVIQTNLGTFRYNQTYPGIIQAYLELCVTLTYLKLWHIQNPNIFRTRGIFRSTAYSQPQYIQNPHYIQNAGIFKIWDIFRTLPYLRWSVNYFHKLELILQSLPRWNKYLEVVSPKVTILCKKLWRVRRPKIVNIIIDIFK